MKEVREALVRRRQELVNSVFYFLDQINRSKSESEPSQGRPTWMFFLAEVGIGRPEVKTKILVSVLPPRLAQPAHDQP